MIILPKFFRVRQIFERPTLDDIDATVHAELAKLDLQSQVQPGQTVAITAGSRGIANIHQVIRAIATHLKNIGAAPFIVPAMGSHGGGTAEGQRQVLEGYGITEEYCGCLIKASMETVEVCRAAEGFPVHFDQLAYEADHVVVCGRIKPHTKFVGEIESGLMKMMLIGLGKHNGAKVYHQAIQDYSFDQIVRSVAGEVMTKCNILCGVAIVENAYDETAKIEAAGTQQIEEREKALLVLAKQWMPRLPFGEVDVLLVDEMGKDISGGGIDANVVGRKYDDNKPTGSDPVNVRRLVCRSLTKASHGNAIGIGYVDLAKTRLIDDVDWGVTSINCITSGHLSGGKRPFAFETDREILETILPTIGLTEAQDAKIQWIRNTLEVIEVECSQAYLPQARTRDDLEILSELRELPFDAAGNLPDYMTELGEQAAV